MPTPRVVESNAAAVAALCAGGLVVLPTETVYGLAADASNPRAVARIYAVKGRPADHPLIVHIPSEAHLDRWVRDVSELARRLADYGWPGPLTLVLPRSSEVGDWVTGGQDTVALRVPDHPVALGILRDFGGAVAAPSANRFGRVSPTTAQHVREDIGELLDPDRDVIVDGGSCQVGVESTIVDCTGPQPVVLRPGRVSQEQIAEWAGVPVAPAQSTAPRVSGSLASHYAPATPVELAEGVAKNPGPSATVGLIALADVETPSGMVRLTAPADEDEYARALYAALREADALRLDRILAVPPTGSGTLAAAIRDRLTRAAAGSAG